MIQNTEVRRGNLVYDNLKRIIRISEVREEHLVFHLSNGSKIKHTLNAFSPIELSEEMLLKCPQFKKSISGHGWFEHEYFTDCKELVEKMIISYNVHSGRFSVGDADEETYPAQTAKVIKHLHRFQNLFVELTDVELEINL